jgi:hypothetical protein
MAGCGFCSYPTQIKLYPDNQGTTIVPILELYNYAKKSGVAVFFVTGRQSAQRQSTIKNLSDAGYSGWTESSNPRIGSKFRTKDIVSYSISETRRVTSLVAAKSAHLSCRIRFTWSIDLADQVAPAASASRECDHHDQHYVKMSTRGAEQAMRKLRTM